MNAIASERVRLGLSQGDLANQLGLKTRSSVASWENRGDIPSSKLVLMSELFRCSVDYLLGLTDERTSRSS